MNRMKRKWVFMPIVSLVVVFLLGIWLEPTIFSPTSAQAPPKVFKIRIQSAVPPANMHFAYLQNLAERVKNSSGGRLVIEVLPDGAVVGAFEILDAVHKGLVEAGYAWSHYWTGKHPACGLFSSPPGGLGMGLDQLTHSSWYYYGGGHGLHKELYAEELKLNVVPYLATMAGPEALGWFKKKINTVEDFKGLRFRPPPGLPGEVYQEMGLKPVFLAAAEIMPAAERGVIDAAEWSNPVDDSTIGFQRVWKNYYLQGAHQIIVSGELIINKAFLETLPADLKAILETSIYANMLDSYLIGIQKNGIALEKLVKEAAVIVQDTPPEYYARFAAATEKVLDKYSSKSPFFKKVVDSYGSFAKDAVPYQLNVSKSNLRNAEGSMAGKQKK